MSVLILTVSFRLLTFLHLLSPILTYLNHHTSSAIAQSSPLQRVPCEKKDVSSNTGRPSEISHQLCQALKQWSSKAKIPLSNS